MSDLKSDTHWPSIINKVADEQSLSKHDLLDLVDKLASFQIDAFQSNIQFCSNLILFVASKLTENVQNNHLTIDECTHVDHSLELIIRNLILSRSAELHDQALSLTQFLNLFSSLLTCESFISINDVQMALSSLKNIPSPQSKADSTTQTTINSLIDDFFNYDSKLESKTDSPRELFSKMVLKHMDHSSGFDVLLSEFERDLTYLNVYRKNHLNQFDLENFKSMNNEEALQARANLSNLINDVTNVHKYVNMLDVCFNMNSDYVKYDDQKLYEFVQSVQIAMLQTCLAEFVLAEHVSGRHDETNLNDLLNLIQLSGEILTKYHGKQMSQKDALIRCFYLEKIIECQNNQLLRYKQLIEQNESESKELYKNLKFLTNIQLNKSLNSYILSKHLFYSKNSISFEHLFRLFKNAFSKSFILNQTKRKKRDSFQKQSDILNLNKIKNIDDPNTDEENYEEDEDTVATTVTNVTNTQTNNLDDDDNCLLIGSWFYEQINSVDEESAIEKENEVNLSNSTQILDTTFDLDTETTTELNDDDLINELIICMQDLQIKKNTFNASLTDYHIQELCSMLKDIELSKSLSENIVLNIYNFVKFLLIKNLINSEKQTLMMDLLGLKDFYSGTTHLYPISQRYLALLTQIFIIQSKDTTKSIQPQALNIWLNFLSSISALIKSNSNQEISISYSSFLLLTFHHLARENRLKILVKMTSLVQDIDRSVVDKKVKLPLLASRLVFLIDYIVHHFERPSLLLLRFIESNFLHFQSHIASDHQSDHEQFLHFIQPTHSHFSFYSLKDNQRLNAPTELYEQNDYEQFYQSLLNLRQFGQELRYSNSDLLSHLSISYLSHLIDHLTHPLDGLRVAGENFSAQHQMYQHLRIISHKKDAQLAAQLQQSFVQFWSQDSSHFDFDLLVFNIELLSAHKSALDLAVLEPIWCQLMSKMSNFYTMNFVQHLKQNVNLEPQVLGLLVSLHKHSDNEQAYSINLDQEEQLKYLSASIKDWNENVAQKLCLIRKFSLKNMSWWCVQASVITAMDTLLSLWLEFAGASVEQAVCGVYANMSLLGGFLRHHLNKDATKQSFNPNTLVHSLLVEYYLVDTRSQLDDKIVLNLLKQVEVSLDQTVCLQWFVDFYESDDKLFQLMTTLSSAKASRQYLVQLIAILNKLFKTNMSAPSKQMLQVLSQLNGIASLEQDSLQKWLLKLVCNEEFSVHEKFVLQQFVIYLTSDSQINESVCLTILNTLIQLSNNLIADNATQSLPDLVCLMDTLCCSGTGLGYLYLFKACLIWIEFYTSCSLVESKTNQKAVCYIVSYLISILNCVKTRASTDTSELAKFYKDSLLVDFEKQVLKLFDRVEKSCESVSDEQDELAQTNDCDLLETEIYENNSNNNNINNNPTIDDTCNDQDVDENFELNRHDSEDDDDEDNEFEDDEQFEPVVEPVPSANLDINELFGAYGVAYQIFDESGDVLRNENRLDDVMDEEDDDDEDEEERDDDDDEYGDDFADNFVDYDAANARSESNRNIYQDLISSISAASINYRQSGQVAPKPKKNTANDEDDDDDLNSKLCTYTMTKKEFMNQHWYYCHTCKMVERIGMCTVCAKVCHGEHDVSYAKFGSFFCDCGAKEDATCKALHKRTQSRKSARQKVKKSSSSLSSPPAIACSQNSTLELLKKCLGQARMQKALKIDKLKQQIEESMQTKNVSALVKKFLCTNLLVEANRMYESTFLASNTATAKSQLAALHANLANLCVEQQQLFQVTLGSQEGAFENVRLTYTGDHGLLIKQLVQNCSLRRVSMCLVSTKQRTQNLIVTHEKGKSSHLTILQLNALLKQDSNKRNKLTLTKLNTIPVPFTLLTVNANPFNEHYISLTGLKDCYVMHLNDSGQQTDAHRPNLIVLHPSLQTSDYIIKSIWLPASQTQLALVTSDFVKIYDLSVDKISPVFYFVLPMAKLKDVTFYTDNKEDKKYVCMITSDGYLYFEQLNETTSAANGIYYVTNTIETGTDTSNGVSIYYSFKLALLFWSLQNGKTWMAEVSSHTNQLTLGHVTQLSVSKAQPLCNWSEMATHPGLVMASTLISNNPVVFMFRPDAIYYQEIKMMGAHTKAKIQDMVAVRHPEVDLLVDEESGAGDEELSGLPAMNKEKTTMIVLCDDGSLKIYVADAAKTDFWLAPHLQPTQPIVQLKSVWSSCASLYQLSPHVIRDIAAKQAREKQKTSSMRAIATKKCAKLKLKAKGEKSGLFPIDYFEKCVQVKDVEFGGADLTQIYNSSQLRARLSDPSSSKYISVRKAATFRLEVTNVNDSNRTLLMGVRVMCGVACVQKSPSYFEVFGRRVYVKMDRARWFDVCLSREEAFVADNKLVIVVGASADGSGLTFIDAVHAYAKSKSELNWTKNECVELQRKFADNKDKKDGDTKPTVVTKKQSDPKKSFVKLLSLIEPKPFDYVLSQTIDLYELCVLDTTNVHCDQMSRNALTLLSKILPPIVLYKVNSLLVNSSLTPSACAPLKIDSMLTLVAQTLNEQTVDSIDCEIFEKCLVCLKCCLNSTRLKLSGQFFALLNKLMWKLIGDNATTTIGMHKFSNLNLVVETLIEIEHFCMLGEEKGPLTDTILQSYLNLLCSDLLQINLTSRRVLLGLLKPASRKNRADDTDDTRALAHTRKLILQTLVEHIGNLNEVNPRIDGLKSIAFYQVIVSLLADLNAKDESDKKTLDLLIRKLLDTISTLDESNAHLFIQSNTANQLKLVTLRTVSILLSKSKYQRSGTETCNFIIQSLVSHLIRFNLIDKCLQLLKHVLTGHWCSASASVKDTGLIKVSGESLFYDELAPFFVKTDPLNKDSFVVPAPNLALLTENASPEANLHIKLFDNYIELFTELLIRLPYQMKKLCLGSSPCDMLDHINGQFNFSHWTYYLCEYLQLAQCNYLKRLIKKLLQILCGSKDKYRKFKDQHILSSCLSRLVEMCALGVNPKPTSMLHMGYSMAEALDAITSTAQSCERRATRTHIASLTYLHLVKVVDNLKLVAEVASSRAANWQKFCIQNASTICYLIEMCLMMGIDANGSGTDSSSLNNSSSSCPACTSVIPPIILQILQSLFALKNAAKCDSDQVQCQILVGIFFTQTSRDMILKFVRTFLLEAFQPQIRWSMHTLVHNLFKNASSQNQIDLYEILASLWSDAMNVYGAKSAQYCDLMGYFNLKLANDSYHHDYINKLIELFHAQNRLLKNHPNSLIYESVSELDGFYLESDPCFICNNLDQPIQSLKLNSLKVDARFTTSQQIYKLASTYSVQKILFKLSDVRKTKMIQSISVYFTNRQSHSIVDLKMNAKLWSKAKQLRMEPGQTELKIDLQLPIICSSIMFEYADFYERDSDKSAESAVLQCPRCSASVPAHPGVCNTCGENVFQCHKCRAINYDERDPFLCNSCGFCKFAKFDISLVGRQITCIDPIHTEDDRKSAIQNMNSLLDRADKIHTQMWHETKPLIEAMIVKQDEQSLMDKFTPSQPSTAASQPQPPPPPPPPPPPSQAASNSQPGVIGVRMAPLTLVTKTKNALSVGQKYAECRSKFDELAKIVLKLNLCRKELREYDKQFKCGETVTRSSLKISSLVRQSQKCYGCASACLEHCFNAFRVILCSANPKLIAVFKDHLANGRVLEQILNFNLRRNLSLANVANVAQNEHAQKLLDRDLINTVYMIVKDNVDASHTFDKIVKQKLENMLDEWDVNAKRSSLKHELLILSSLVQKCDDSCWLVRFRLVVHILMQSVRRSTNCRLVNELTLPCLRILSHLVKSSTSTANNNNNKKIDLATLLHPCILLSTRQTDKLSDDSLLKLKCLLSWKQAKEAKEAKEASVFAGDLNWLRMCLFCASNRSVRQLTASLVQNLFAFYSTSCANDERKFLIVDFMGEHVNTLSGHDDHHLDYCDAFKQILTSNDRESKYRLVVKHKILTKLELLIQAEIKQLNEMERLSDDSLLSQSFDLNRGLCIKTLGELLALFLKEPTIKTKFKSRLIATVLNAYLSLKKLLYQRTKLIDEAQEKLLNTLELLTSGTEQETRHFMSICIDTVRNFDLDDLVTPVFIFERLSNIIYPEDVVDNKQFLIVLEKDPNQEDYLQGRMLGNPYSSSEAGLGPLMRNIKNKICTDSELIALLEDDNGMELLVNNKIISLELSVRDVYKKVWLSECLSEHEPMRIVYRMTGLLGDATEDIIDNLEPKKLDAATKDDEQQQVYRMADELAYNAALPVMLERLASINQQNFSIGKPLLRVLLKLFDYALKLKVNRTVLIKPQLKTISTMLQTLNMMLKLQVDVSLTEKLIAIMQVILSEASQQPPDVYNEFSALCGHTEQLQFLLSNIKSTYVRGYSNLMQALMGLIPFLSFGDQTKMKMLIEHFSTYVCSFDRLDTSATNEDTLHLECFCVIVNGIESGPNGTRLRDMMSSSGIVQNAIDYLLHNSPPITTYFNSDNDLWHHFIGRKSLPYALRILTGLSKSHRAISDSIGAQCVPVLHKLEQFTSENLVGVIAEDLLAVLRQNGSHQVTSAIQQMQEQTKNEKKKLAMAKRNKQLSQLGMKTNEKGQLLINPDSLKNIQVEEEKGHVCCICRDGYKYNPQKLLAIYTFSKKCELEANEIKARKTLGFTTVTHFNLVHAECHTNAIRSSRTCRDEWENAALQNANTKCNGILPIWGPDVTETLFSNALARHNNYLLDATGIRDLNYSLYVHDLKALLNRFAENLSFSEDTGGGGRESNINLVPYIIHAILYSLNTAKYVQKEEQNVAGYLAHKDKLLQNSFECDNVFYYMSLSLCVMRAEEWKVKRVEFLQRAVCTVHARLVNGPGGDKTKLASTVLLEFKKYKPCVLFVGIVDLFFKHLMAKVTAGDRPWTELLATYIRHNDVSIMEFCKKILHEFEEELMVSEDWLEMFDVLGFMRDLDITDPVEFLTAYLQTVGK